MPRERRCTAGPKAKEVKQRADKIAEMLAILQSRVNQFHQQNDLDTDDLATLGEVGQLVQKAITTLYYQG